MIKLTTYLALTGILFGVLLIFIKPDLLNYSLSFIRQTNQQLNMPNNTYLTGSTDAQSFVVLPIVFGILGALLGITILTIVKLFRFLFRKNIQHSRK